MSVSVVIPVLNEAARIEQAIDRAWLAGAGEVIVVDGGSSDGTPEVATKARCFLLQSPSGRARQQNLGATVAQGDWLLFLHVDCWLEPESIVHAERQLGGVEPCSGRENDWGAFHQKIDAPGFLFRCLEWGNARRIAWCGVPYGDQAIFVRASVFRQCGGFPEVALLEDLLLSRTLRRRRWPTLLAGPLHVDARRWQRYGVIRQTLRNWRILLAWKMGATPDRLARLYPRHDEPPTRR